MQSLVGSLVALLVANNGRDPGLNSLRLIADKLHTECNLVTSVKSYPRGL